MLVSRLLVAALAATSVVALTPATAAAAFSDGLCPRAVPKVVALDDAAPTSDFTKISAAARDAAVAYQICTSEAQTTKGTAVEPTVNYDKTREAQFLVVEARALVAAGNPADALAPLKEARRLADDVATWQPGAQTWRASQNTGAPGGNNADNTGLRGGNTAYHSSDRDGSRYKEAATEIRSSADELLTRVQARAPASPKP